MDAYTSCKLVFFSHDNAKTSTANAMQSYNQCDMYVMEKHWVETGVDYARLRQGCCCLTAHPVVLTPATPEAEA